MSYKSLQFEQDDRIIKTPEHFLRYTTREVCNVAYQFTN